MVIVIFTNLPAAFVPPCWQGKRGFPLSGAGAKGRTPPCGRWDSALSGAEPLNDLMHNECTSREAEPKKQGLFSARSLTGPVRRDWNNILEKSIDKFPF